VDVIRDLGLPPGKTHEIVIGNFFLTLNVCTNLLLDLEIKVARDSTPFQVTEETLS
jgi:hypothetical protein